jgi:hypothetical protein
MSSLSTHRISHGFILVLCMMIASGETNDAHSFVRAVKCPSVALSSPPRPAPRSSLSGLYASVVKPKKKILARESWEGLSCYIAVMFGPSQCTPRHVSLHGSPPASVHPSSSGEPSAAYRSLIASTAERETGVPSY